jgi:multidrug efflux pump subunit AcrB
MRFLKYCVQHRIAANLLLFAMILSGFFGLAKLNTQFLPTFDTKIISVQLIWPKHQAEDVEQSILIPVEQALQGLNGVKDISGEASNGQALLRLQMQDSVSMQDSVAKIRDRISVVKGLPTDMEAAKISHAEFYHWFSQLVISGPNSEELRYWAKKAERELLAAGIAKVELQAYPAEEIRLTVQKNMLSALGLSVPELAIRIAKQNQAEDVAVVGHNDSKRQIKTVALKKKAHALEALWLTDRAGRPIQLSEVVKVDRGVDENSVLAWFQGRPAINIKLYRTDDKDTFASVRIMQNWLQQARATWPASLQFNEYNEQWRLLEGRIRLLLENGMTGVLLVLGLLLMFLHRRIAFWVALGIPVSFAATLFILHLFGGSINMLSLFAFIMCLGIIVDDTIVVGEQSLQEFTADGDPEQAAYLGAKKMFVPVMASSLTTVFSFLPLFVVSGIMGQVLRDIPLVVIAVILASIVECFLVLPGHLKSSFKKMKTEKPGRFRVKFDHAFDRFRDHHYKNWLTACMRYYWRTLASAMMLLFLVFALASSGRMQFNFFPLPNMSMLWLDASFIPGTTKAEMQKYILQAERSLQEGVGKIAATGKSPIKSIVAFVGRGNFPRGANPLSASLRVELLPPEDRALSNTEIIKAWKQALPPSVWIEQLSLGQPKAGPPGADIDIVLLNGKDMGSLKQASLALQKYLKTYPGVGNIRDDLTAGQSQWRFDLKEEAIAGGIDRALISKQLQAAMGGQVVENFYEGEGEVEMVLRLADSERKYLAQLMSFPIITAAGSTPLSELTHWQYQQGYHRINHHNMQRSVNITAEVNATENNANNIMDDLKRGYLSELAAKYQVTAKFKGRAEDQAQTLRDLKWGLCLAVLLIYFTLAWVAESYVWPLILMAIIPFGLMGGLLGHVVLGIDVTILSLFGLFGLSGIMLNDSIILLLTFRGIHAHESDIAKSLHLACKQRLRPVLLTSLTTMGGLLPLLFERSVQAQFLIPMAVTIIFGLAISTVLILLMIPACFMLGHAMRAKMRFLRS